MSALGPGPGPAHPGVDERAAEDAGGGGGGGGGAGAADTARPVGRPRDPAVDRAALEATVALLAEAGYEGVTIEAVAQAAGVSKNAIYRRWPDKLTMVVDAVGQMAPQEDIAVDTGDIRSDITTMLLRISQKLCGTDGRLASSLTSDIVRHPELADAFRARMIEPRRRQLTDRVRRAVEAGQLPPDSDVELLTAVGPALLYHRLLFDGEAPDEGYVRRVVAQFWS